MKMREVTREELEMAKRAKEILENLSYEEDLLEAYAAAGIIDISDDDSSDDY